MKKLLFVLMVVMLCSCSSESKEDAYITGNSSYVGDNSEITYIKDERTGLCFAERGWGQSYTFTCIPCIKEVEDLIKYSK